MLTQEENELLTRTGPGTPGGELFRRYWHPVAIAGDLTAERPTLRIKVLHEDLVVYREPEGGYGLLAERCAHRGASLAYGFVERGGLRCAYHGWKYDRTGRCLEQPFEPEGSHYREKIRQPAYPVQELGGLLFAYFGPDPAPLLPRWDVLVRRDGHRKLRRHPVLDCSWLQAQENSVDTVHTYFLHGHMMKTKGIAAGQYYLRPLKKYEFEQSEWGIVKRRTYAGDNAETELGHPAIFPNMLLVPEGPWKAMHWRVPIDDTHTRIFWAGFRRSEDGEVVEGGPEIEDMPVLRRADGEYAMDTFASQDKMAWETPGPLYDRSQEHLGASDRGIIMWRRLLRQQIEIVRGGGEPMALVRDEERNRMITIPVSEGQARREYVEARGDYYAVPSARSGREVGAGEGE